VINVSKWVCLAIAVVLIVSAAVLILNSIRMAIFARRREVSVMKLVGATNWFIRVPFMSEGLIQGLSGRRWPLSRSTSCISSSIMPAAGDQQ
jgi:cell division transport system permease protein